MDEHELHSLGLPKPGTAPTFHPEAPGVERALARARHRRTSRGLSVALAALALPAAAVFMLPSDTQDDSLRFAGTPSSSPSERVPERTEQATPTPPTGGPEPGSEPRSAAGPAATADPQPQPQEEPEPGAAPMAAGEPDVNAVPQRDDRPAVVEAPREVPGHDCGNVEDAPDNFAFSGACVRTQGPATLRRGESASFVLSFCKNAVSNQSATFPFPTGQEHEMVVRDRADDENGFPTDDGALRWQWSRSVRFTQGAHERTLAPNRCLEWTNTWDGRDQAGELLPAGDYEIRMRITESSGSWSGTVGQRVTITD